MSGFDLAARQPVWVALAELFLDTDVRFSYVWIAETLAASPYSLEEMRRILADEVTPVLQHNLCSVAGEWVGFDQEWLVEQVSARVGKRRWLPALVDLSGDWHVLAALIQKLRELPDREARAQRLAAWRVLMPLFLQRECAVATGYTPEHEAIFHEELWPLLIGQVREYATARSQAYPDEAGVLVNWKQYTAGS